MANIEQRSGGLPSSVVSVSQVADVIAPAATGVAATDRANLVTAIAATPTGGLLQLRGGVYQLDQALVVDHAMTIRGFGIHETWGSQSVTQYSIAMPVTAPYLAGTVLNQTLAGADGLTVTAVGRSVHLQDFGVMFDSTIRWSNTGHGINATPPNDTGGGPDNGLTSFTYKNISVFGHDGNHYGYNFINPLLGKLDHIRSYGGGGVRIENNSTHGAWGRYGNLTIIEPYVAVVAGGSAHGYRLLCTSPTTNSLNLITFVRPQAWVSNFATAAGLVPAPASDPTNAQLTLKSDAGVQFLTVIGPDLETNVAGGVGPTWPTAGGLFVDPGGLQNNSTGFDIFYPIIGGGVSLHSDMNFHNKAETAGILGGVYDEVAAAQLSGVQGSAPVAPYKGASSGVPWPAARRAGLGGLLADTVGGKVQFSDGANWSDVAAPAGVATPVIAALTDIANLSLDLDVNRLGLGDNVACATLTDRSGGAHDFTAAGTAQPTFRSLAAFSTPSGKPSLVFNGGTNVMNNAALAQAGAFTDFVIVARQSNSVGYLFKCNSNGGSGDYLNFPGGGQIGLNGNGVAVAQSASTFPLGTAALEFFLVTVRSDGTFRVDSTPMGTLLAPVAQTFTGSNILLGSGLSCYIARAVRYSAALTDTQVRSVEIFLRAWASTN